MNLRFLASRAPFIGALLPFLLVTAPVPSGAGMSLAIVPPYIEKVVPSGSRITDTLSFTNTGDEAVLVSVDFADFGVSEAGEVSEQPPGSTDDSLVPSIRISPMHVRVVPEQQVFFRYSVETPADFGQLRAMIYVSSFPETPPGPNQVQVVARMGVPIYVENRKSAPADLKVESLEWDRFAESPDQIRVRLTVVNEGERNIRPEGFVHVETVDGRDRRTFDFNEGREPVLPGQRRRWERYFGPVPEGDLAVKLRLATSQREAFEAEATLVAGAH